MNMSKETFKESIFIIIGVIITAIGVEYFYAPNNIAAGGISGLAIILNSYIPKLGIGIISLGLNIIIFALGYIILGKEFGLKSIITGLGFSVVIWIIETFLNPFAITEDLMLATIFGTIISAFGIALVFNNNSSTGGTDIIAKILNKYTHINLGISLLIVDMFITILCIIRFGLNIGLYALLGILILGILIDKFIDGFNSCKETFIISEKCNDISKYIMNDLQRGCTYLNGKGAYTNKDLKIIYTILERNEFIKLRSYIKNVDSKAFIIVRQSHEIIGEGFKKLE